MRQPNGTPGAMLTGYNLTDIAEDIREKYFRLPKTEYFGPIDRKDRSVADVGQRFTDLVEVANDPHLNLSEQAIDAIRRDFAQVLTAP